MTNITEEFKKLWKHEEIDSGMLVPLMVWVSGSEKNIESVQALNRMFKYVNKEILSHNLTLSTNIRHFFKYPKTPKEDEKTKFFYDDLRKYLGLSKIEFQKNISIIDVESFKETIAKTYAYDNKQRRTIKLKKRICK